jgi:hypothetical protein
MGVAGFNDFPYYIRRFSVPGGKISPLGGEFWHASCLHGIECAIAKTVPIIVKSAKSLISKGKSSLVSATNCVSP